MNRWASLFAIVFLLFLAACGGGSKSINNPPPVTGTTYSNSSVSGTWAMSFTGEQPYSTVGFHATFTSDGAGNISNGSIMAASVNVNSAQDAQGLGTFTGTYSVSADGRGTMTISPSGLDMATFKLYFVLNSTNAAQLSSIDPAFVGTGSMVQQKSSITTVAGTYAFVNTIQSIATPMLAITVGQITFHDDGTITGMRDLAVQSGTAMVSVTPQDVVSGTYSTPTAGVTVATITYGLTTRHVRIIFSGNGEFFMMGTDLHQLLSGTGTQVKQTTFSGSSLTGASLLTVLGREYDSNLNGFGKMGMIGRMVSDGSSAISGNSYHFLDMETLVNENFTAAYVPDPAGRFVVQVTDGPTLYLYLTDSNSGVFLAASGNTIAAGAITPQATQTYSKASLRGQYGVMVFGTPFFAVGQIKADGLGAVTGTVDAWDGSTNKLGAALTGSYTVNGDGSGQFTAGLNGGSQFTFALYMADSNHFVAMGQNPEMAVVTGVAQK
jgi:hypothetical protein